jgi:MFS family permease
MSNKKPGMFSVFQNKSFTLLWVAQLISAMGSALTSLAASIYVFRVTGSALNVGLMLMATAAPTIFIGLFAGVFVDRGDRKKIMLAADLVRGILIFLIPTLLPLGIAWLYIIVALCSGIAQFFDSANASVVPEVATEDELAAANALMSVSSIGSTTIGFAAAGIIASSTHIEWAFYLDAFSFIVSAALILLTKIPRLEVTSDTSLRAVAINLKAGLQYVRDTKILRSLIIVIIPVLVIFGLQNSLFLPFALRALNATEFEFGLQQGAESIGIALGSMLMARLADRIREGQWLVISYVSMAMAAIVYALSHSVALAIFLVGLSGFLNAPSYVGRQLIIQRNTPREMRGRVNSAFFVVRDVFFLIGMALAGLADIMDVRALFLYSSLILLFVGTFALFMPGLGQPTEEWKRTVRLLRGTPAAARLSHARAATAADFEKLFARIPELAELSLERREALAAQTLVSEAAPGTVIIYRGETSNDAYFILSGQVGVGFIRAEEYEIVGYLHAGDFFGEIVALMGGIRTVNVIAEEQCTFLVIPARILRQLEKEYISLQKLFFTTMMERMSQLETFSGAFDQGDLRELRTNPAER